MVDFRRGLAGTIAHLLPGGMLAETVGFHLLSAAAVAAGIAIMFGRLNAAMKIKVAVSLRKNRQPIAQPRVVIAEARAMIKRAPHFFLAVFFVGEVFDFIIHRVLRRKIAVIIRPKIMTLEHCLRDGRQHDFALEGD